MKKLDTSGQGLDEFAAQYDKNVIVPNKIKAGLEKLANRRKDGTAWETEVNFLKTAALSTTDLSLFRDQFTAYHVNVGTDRQPKRVWFGSKVAADKARSKVQS